MQQVGYLVHHASSLQWAGIHEYWHLRRPVRSRRQAVAHALVIASSACLVDYTITPRRFRPGFERHLSRRSIGLVYAGFAAGLVTGTWLVERRRRSTADSTRAAGGRLPVGRERT